MISLVGRKGLKCERNRFKNHKRVVYNGMYILVAAGLILFLTGFLGCFGAIRENKFLLCMVRIPVFSWIKLEKLESQILKFDSRSHGVLRTAFRTSQLIRELSNINLSSLSISPTNSLVFFVRQKIFFSFSLYLW